MILYESFSRVLICMFVLLGGQSAYANMAESGIVEGETAFAPFLSLYVDILHEQLNIIPQEGLDFARIEVEYRIDTKEEGARIPIIFYAKGENSNFQVKLDGQNIPTKPPPEQYQYFDGLLTNDFDSLFEPTAEEKVVFWEEVYIYDLNEIQYFEVAFEKGTHTISVEYDIRLSIDKTGWVSRYSLDYVLGPANFWKSFGTLDITLQLPEKTLFESDLLPQSKQDGRDIVWHFDQIPQDVFMMTFVPEISRLVVYLTYLDPAGIALILCLPLIWIHIRRMKNIVIRRSLKYVLFMIAGGIVIPIIWATLFLFSYPLIDNLIGEHAGRHHGMIGLIYLFIPYLSGVYVIFAFICDFFSRLLRPPTNP